MNKIILSILLFNCLLQSVTVINKSQDVLSIYINDDAINLKSSPIVTLLPKQQFMQNGIVQIRIMGKRTCKGNFYNMLQDNFVIEFDFNKSIINR